MSSPHPSFKLHKGILTLLLLILLVTSLLAGSTSSAKAGGAPPLFKEAGRLPPAQDRPEESFVIRSRYVSVNLELLVDASGNPRSRRALPEILLELFPDALYTGVVTRVEQDELGTSWTGRLRGRPEGYFYLTMVDGAFMAHIASRDGIYEVSGAGNDLHRVVQINQGMFIDEPPGTILPEGKPVEATGSDLRADSGATLDVMVVYTPAARAGAGGATAAEQTKNLKTAIALAMTETRDSYISSAVVPRLRIVHIEEVAYVENGDIEWDRDRLVATADGYLDNVHTLRDIYAADMVVLILESANACGIAGAISADATTAFAVVKRPGCLTGYYSFGHELGHLYGARHDPYHDPTNTPYASGHGYVNLHPTDAARRWRTIMAYPDQCQDAGYPYVPKVGYCARLKYWSNPDVIPTGRTDPAGVTGISEDYKVLNTRASAVANFRTALISVNNINDTFTNSSTGWSKVIGNWYINWGHYRTIGSSGYWSTSKHTGTYGDLTYEVRMARNGSAPRDPNGIIIRGHPELGLTSNKAWYSSYGFAYTNDGLFAVHKYDNLGNTTWLRGWTAHSAIVKNGWNKLKVVAVGTWIKFYINDKLVWQGPDSSYRTGTVGLRMYNSPGSTGNLLMVDSAVLTTTVYADPRLDEEVVPGEEVNGGTVDQSP